MAKIRLVQEGKDISIAVKNIIATSGTSLTKVCEKNELHYGETHKKINSKYVDIDWLKELVQKINPDAVIGFDVSLKIEIDGNIVFHQKIEE